MFVTCVVVRLVRLAEIFEKRQKCFLASSVQYVRTNFNVLTFLQGESDFFRF